MTAARDFDFDSVAEVRRCSLVLRDAHTLDKGDLFPQGQSEGYLLLLVFECCSYLIACQNGRRRTYISSNGSPLPPLRRDNRYYPSSAKTLRVRKHGILIVPVVGRDKLLRTLQYFSRFYAWYLYRTNNPARVIAPFEAIKKQFALTRKCLRIGKNVEHFKAAAVAMDAKGMDPVLRYCAVGRQLGYAGYLTFDMVAYVS